MIRAKQYNRLRFRLVLICAIALIVSKPLFAQTPKSEADRVASQLSLDIGPIAGTISYAWLVPERGVGYGIGGGFSWEDISLVTDKNIWDVLHGEFFVRYRTSSAFFVDVGATYMRYAPFDDTDERGSFFGMYVAPMFGYRWIFLGAQTAAGFASDFKGTEFGVAVRPALRLMVSF